ncbi:ComEC/Rec2 family competence protein [Aureivirga sp. CE67]|uniref:ComEC/Rec2 family competence protein n=1 Tax=Aureivirga sp. CE67 TaxID=1788983 RepID=UPI0018CB2903|nr:ComEC/Rec2 family competence protein [Aureivirga sp. CE67]
MRKLLNYIPLPLAICFTLGLVLGFYIEITIISVLVTIFVLAIILFFILRKLANPLHFKNSSSFAFVSFLLVICIGVLTINLHKDKNQKNHFSKNLQENSFSKIKILEVLKPTKFAKRYYGEIVNQNGKESSGKVLIYTDTIFRNLEEGTEILTKAQPKELYQKNNFGFDYVSFLQKKQIFYDLKLNDKNAKFLEGKSSISLASSIRRKVVEKLEKLDLSKDVLAITKALFLGEKQDISKELYQNYTYAGVIHILAISGLHIGILLFILEKLLFFLNRSQRLKIIKVLLQISFLWFFAFVTGFSPSVTRAVTMFSIIAIGLNLSRTTFVFQSILISYLVLLFINPFWLFQVGFQLSYIAVISIVVLKPLLDKLFKPKNKIISKIWDLFSVSVAAQIGILPISLFYFHQFSGLFFVANVLVLFLLEIVLAFGLLLLISLMFYAEKSFISVIYEKIITFMNQIISFFASKEHFVFTNISFSSIDLILLYILLISVFIFSYSKKTYKTTFSFLVIILFVQLSFFQKNLFTDASSKFVVFHKYKSSTIGIVKNKDLKTFGKEVPMIQNYKTNFEIENHKHSEEIPQLKFYDEKKILIINKPFLVKQKLQPDYLLLQNNPKINFEKLIQEQEPKFVVFDGSNSGFYVRNWIKTCKKHKIPFYNTFEKGSFEVVF